MTYKKSLIVYVNQNNNFDVDFKTALFLNPSSELFVYLEAGPYLI